MRREIVLTDAGTRIGFRFEDLLRFHDGNSPAGVAIAFRVLERALPALAAGALCERREIAIATAFGGPGARDAFECATCAVSDGRYRVDAALRRPERGPALERFVFCFSYRGTQFAALLRDGLVSDEFARLAFAPERTPEQDARLAELKPQLAERVLGERDPIELD